MTFDTNPRKHDVERNAKSLCTMDMGQARRVGYDRICDKWVSIPGLKARFPTTVNNLSHFASSSLNSPAADGAESGD